MRPLEDQIVHNKRLSVALLIIVPIVFICVAFVIGSVWGSPFLGLILGTGIMIVYTVGMYNYGPKMVLAAVHAKRANAHTHFRLVTLVEGLCIGAGMHKPKIYVQESPEINAFATGKNPKEGVICVTTGALEKLNKTELEGVLAHELSHIRNYDIRFMTLVVALVGAIAIISQIFLRSLWFGGGRGRGKNGGMLLIIGLVLAILAPIFVTLVQLAISRRREYLADASGAHLTRYPEGLANALEKIKKENKGKMKVSRAVASLYISSPFGKDRVKGMFSTHPPIGERIRRLKLM